MTATVIKSITLAEFLELAETKPASEFIDGQIIQKHMPQGEHSLLQGTLCESINQITIAFPELRCVFGDSDRLPVLSGISLKLIAQQVFSWLSL